jgi:non-ribosomal peptide synthetase component E (peptide arylation enzyme)
VFHTGQVKEVLLMNVSNIIKQHVGGIPDAAAIIFEERRLAYRELDRLINRAAGRC